MKPSWMEEETLRMVVRYRGLLCRLALIEPVEGSQPRGAGQRDLQAAGPEEVPGASE